MKETQALSSNTLNNQYLIRSIFSLFTNVKDEQDLEILNNMLALYKTKVGNISNFLLAIHPEKKCTILHLLVKRKVDHKLLSFIETFIDKDNLKIYNLKDKDGYTPFLLSMLDKQYYNSLNQLIESQKRVLVSYNYSQEQINEELKNTINIRNYKGHTALHLAAANNDVEKVKKILSVGGDVTIKDNLGDTAAHLAARNIHNPITTQNILCILARAGCDPHSINKRNKTVLEEAHDNSECLDQESYKFKYRNIFLWKEENNKEVIEAYNSCRPRASFVEQIQIKREEIRENNLSHTKRRNSFVEGVQMERKNSEEDFAFIYNG